jgi:hypothetical protein
MPRSARNVALADPAVMRVSFVNRPARKEIQPGRDFT